MTIQQQNFYMILLFWGSTYKMANNNTTQKILIYNLTITNPNSKQAYKNAIQQAKTNDQKTQILKIAKFFKITL